MTRFDVSPFISEHASHRCAWRARRGLSPVPWTSPFVVNRPKSSLRRKSALPVVRLDISAQLSGLYNNNKKRHRRASVRDMEALKRARSWLEERLEVVMCRADLETEGKKRYSGRCIHKTFIVANTLFCFIKSCLAEGKIHAEKNNAERNSRRPKHSAYLIYTLSTLPKSTLTQRTAKCVALYASLRVSGSAGILYGVCFSAVFGFANL